MTKNSEKEWNDFRAALVSVDKEQPFLFGGTFNIKTVVRNIAVKSLLADGVEEIGSSDISCEMFNIWKRTNFELGALVNLNAELN